MPKSDNAFYWLCHIAFWFPLLFATPVFVALKNFHDFQFQLITLLIYLALITAFASIASYRLTGLLGGIQKHRISIFMLTLSIVLVVQGNVVHEFFDYGQFNGEEANWRNYGWKFWLEIASYIGAIPILFWVLSRSKRVSGIIPLLLLGSSCSLFLPDLLAYQPIAVEQTPDELIDSEVFEFSSRRNLIHLIPDGLQSDIVKEVLKENPDLEQRFRGFIFFDNHLAQFQGTGPSIPTIYNGRIYDLSRGYSFPLVREEMDNFAYQNTLVENDYQLDFVSILAPFCTKEAASCVVRGFNDMKARGYYRHNNNRLIYSIRLIADLTLFRHVPMFFKEVIYRNGDWLFSATDLDGTSRYPDPVIREWIENISIVDSEPKYKSYHYIGTHIPPRWNSECEFTVGLERTRENYKAQTFCLLTGLSDFFKMLEQHNIYDETAIVITGDHGNNTEAYDIIGEPTSSIFSPRFIGSARPAFLVKQLNNRDALRYSNVATTMSDIAPTALDLVELESEFEGVSALREESSADRLRTFHRYDASNLWQLEPIPFSEYQVTGDVKNAANWRIKGIHNVGTAPSSYADVSRASIGKFSLGLSISDQDQAWVYGSEFAFLISRPSHDFDRMRIGMHIPEFIEDQTLEISINDGVFTEPVSLNFDTEFWTEVDVPVNPVSVMQENNFIHVRLGKAESPPENPGRPLSVFIRSIEFL